MAFYTCDELTPDLCDLKEERGQVEIKGIQVTYFKYSLPTSPNSNDEQKLPIIAIHGGPSFAHNYMLPLKQQACRGREIVFYDQAGCGRSRPTPGPFNASDYPWLLDPLYYSTVELPAVLQHLGFQDFHIIASSWGTMLTQLYALEAKDETRKHLKSMVLSGPLSDSQKYIQAQWDPHDGNLGSLPPFIQSRIHALEKDGAYDSDEYQAIDSVLTGKFTVRTQPAPDCWFGSENGANLEIYTALQGPSEFTMQGVLGDFNVTGRLGEVQVPTLLSHGKFDTMRPSIVETMRKALPYAETLFLERSGHVSMIDEPGPMNDGVAEFFDRVEASQGNAEIHWRQSLKRPADNGLGRMSFKEPSVNVSVLIVTTFVALTAGFILGRRREKSLSRSDYTALRESS